MNRIISLYLSIQKSIQILIVRLLLTVTADFPDLVLQSLSTLFLLLLLVHILTQRYITIFKWNIGNLSHQFHWLVLLCMVYSVIN